MEARARFEHAAGAEETPEAFEGLGSFGDDTLVGFGGPDILNGGAGHDKIDAFDGEPDQIFCGPSLDDDVFKDKVIDVENGDCG